MTANRTVLLVGALASAGAGLVHAAAAGSHSGDQTLAIIFAITAALQLGWAALAAFRPRVDTAIAGLLLNAGALFAWTLSRTSGIPLIESLASAEKMTTPDLMAAILAGVAAFGAGLSVVVRRDTSLSRLQVAPVVVAGALIMAMTMPGMVAGHSHGAGDEHGHEGAAGDDHHKVSAEDEHAHEGADDHGTEGHDAAGAHSHDGGRITSIDDERLTPEQRRAAQDLIDRTQAGARAFPTVAALEAAGYETINDAITGVEHFINHNFTKDGKELDANAIESFVAETKPGQPKRVVSAMYILEEGKTMDGVPEIADTLTTWHLHDDLCWDPTGKRVMGNFRLGRCLPAGELKATPPMLHVWLEPQKCGPFAEAELTANPVDDFLRARGLLPPAPAPDPNADPCDHTHTPGAGHGGGESTGGASAGHEADGHKHGGAATPTAADAGHNHHQPKHLDHAPTAEQKSKARELIERTKRDTAKYEDVKVAEANGYKSIGDGMTGVEHWVNLEYQRNKNVLDSTQPESLVYKVHPDGRREYLTTMYIMPDGSEEAEIPDVAGNLTVWHKHDNLCFDPNNPPRLGGVLINGKCTPGGVLVPSEYMLHVWVKDNPCGPFAGADAGQDTGSCLKPDF